MNSKVLCDKKNVLLIKSFTDDEDEKYDLSFSCNYNEDCNLFHTIKMGNFYKLLYILNQDLVSEYSHIKNDSYDSIFMYLKDDYDGTKYAIVFDVIYNYINDTNVNITCKENDIVDIKEGYTKCQIHKTITTIKLNKGIVNLDFSIVITEDNLENDIKAILMKKKIYRLKKFIEKK